jgi:hypothetical protein
VEIFKNRNGDITVHIDKNFLKLFQISKCGGKATYHFGAILIRGERTK